MTEELASIQGEEDEDRALSLNIDIGRLKDALQSNIEATLVSQACVMMIVTVRVDIFVNSMDFL